MNYWIALLALITSSIGFITAIRFTNDVYLIKQRPSKSEPSIVTITKGTKGNISDLNKLQLTDRVFWSGEGSDFMNYYQKVYQELYSKTSFNETVNVSGKLKINKANFYLEGGKQIGPELRCNPGQQCIIKVFKKIDGTWDWNTINEPINNTFIYTDEQWERSTFNETIIYLLSFNRPSKRFIWFNKLQWRTRGIQESKCTFWIFDYTCHNVINRNYNINLITKESAGIFGFEET